jgi:multisubunit Na+/H+ antiporter MnhF subunit
MWIVTIIYWLQAFAAPVIILGLIALWTNSSRQIAIILLIIGVLAGIVLAEYIRRKIGLDTFFARIYGPNAMDDKLKNKD